MSKGENGMKIFVDIFGSERTVKTLPVIGFIFILMSGLLPFIKVPSLRIAMLVIIFVGTIGFSIFCICRLISYYSKKNR